MYLQKYFIFIPTPGAKVLINNFINEGFEKFNDFYELFLLF